MKTANRLASILGVATLMVLAAPAKVVAEDPTPIVMGTVTEVQKYGNLTLDIKPKALYDAGFALGDILTVRIAATALKIPFCTSYSDVDTGGLVVRDDQKNDAVVVAINMGNFATTYKAKVGDSVTLALQEKGGYLSEYLLRQLKRSNRRSDYATDSVFANFRSVVTTGIKPALLYRSSNPADDQLGRAAYADSLAKAVGVRTVINLADTDQNLKSYFGAPGFKSTYYQSLYDAGRVKALNMGVDLGAPDFGAKFAEGIRFMITKDGPYLVHCTEGKDRAGFVSAVLEALMGAKLQEIVADYMLSYEDYYGVKRDSDQYAAIAKSNIVASMTTVVCGLPKGTDLSGTDLAAAAEGYLKRIGLTTAEIRALKTKLSGEGIIPSPQAAGKVTQIEKYGHALTDITIADFNARGFKFGDLVTVVFDNGFVLEAPYLDGYYVDTGAPLVRAYPGQQNIALCINYGKLNEVARIGVGSACVIARTGPGAYLAQYEIRKLVRSDKRTDYPSDEAFANFRALPLGTVAKGTVYRSSSPIDNQLGRAAYADALAKKAGIATVVNLADSQEAVKTFLGAKDFASPYYAELYKKDRIVFLNMNLAYGSDEFRANVAKGLEFMAERDGPYLIHCAEGKDRTGFVSALLEALMGASKDQIVADYMRSYTNYYGVQGGTAKYDLISQDVLGMLKVITGSSDPAKADLAAGARNYLIAGGMTADQIERLKTRLAAGPSTSQVPLTLRARGSGRARTALRGLARQAS